ncbi:MAG: prepilin-type N-terminal cleavage/methylation domain-containing protein [Candidatus Eremiobacteraeota bacterium]|nr:prepilin-type N-terminal cleavage/methylation domain-containing protein [Candidatus Eremiobacteraeota bacterium]
MKLRCRGITLVEIVVASFVMSILLTVMVKVLVPALRAWSDGQKRSEVGQSLLVTTSWLGDDIVRSAPDSLSVNEEGILGMRCALGQQESYENEFKEVVAYWIVEKELYRADKTLDESASGAPLLTLEELQSFESKRRVGSGVEVFEVTAVTPWRVDVHLVVEKDGRSAEIRTGFSSMYAPFDPNTKEKELGSEEEEG